MSILIANCFHWVGFHLLNELLEQGVEVSGYDEMDTSKKEHLSMFVGRNVLFSMVEDENSSSYETAIIVEDYNVSPILASRKIRIGTNHYRNENEQDIYVHTPILFGKWMPMTEEGLYYRGNLVPFDSEEFLSNAVYIDDFVQTFMRILEVNNLPDHLKVYSKKNREDEVLKLENSLFIRDNVPIEENLNKVLAHYRQFQEFY